MSPPIGPVPRMPAKIKCVFCEGTDGGHNPINDTMPYSGIEIAMSTHCKDIRVRVYPSLGYDGGYEYMDLINIKYCPMCGRALS